ncbi:ATP-dependent Clp protease ATP-binding subunit [Prochlorothrix hollandica]|uniref:Clp protease ClpX n=1 Tax=Prochlorothrix hollandica PCC 9006 = CALU 1027 TaxID=317619 RepID=A0A0M2PXC2_PROHO|nr:ATP-dependent Clp protease ATP-binding subunit [Prochlorothrix hollandica]KKI99308.1 Clp protease ClpX [Prochlorothrix hollandica PCC 9006 = CALU 1027]
MFEYFTDQAVKVVMMAQEEARRLNQSSVGTEQLLLGLLREDVNMASKILKDLGVTLEGARQAVLDVSGRGNGPVPTDLPFTPKAKKVLEQSFQEARQLSERYITPNHLLLALSQDQGGVAAKVLRRLGVDPIEVRNQLIRRIGEESVVAGDRPTLDPERPRDRRSGKALKEFGTNLTDLAREGKLDPVVGRAVEIERVVQILGRRTKNNPILLGEPGVGKTAIAEGIAQRIVQQDVPESLLNQEVISLDMGTIVAGTRFRGDFEERLTQILSEVKESGNVILVMDEVHTMVGGGSFEGGTDAANLMKPALARGELQCIGATTTDEYRKYIERDEALARRFQPVKVNEPTITDTVEILRGLRSTYEAHHRVIFSDESLLAAAQLSHRYINDRFLPDKAIDLMDESGSRMRLRHARKSSQKDLQKELRQVQGEKQGVIQSQDFPAAAKLRDQELALERKIRALEVDVLPAPLVVTGEEIAEVVALWTGVPVSQLSETETANLLNLETHLHERVIGQDEAVAAVAKAMRRARVGLSHPNRPIASLVFSGPTGVGKTELSKALAAALFGSEDALIRVDMSEFMERHEVSKLIGSPPGFVGFEDGGKLTEAVRRRPYSVILLDEVEKAHPDVFNILLQMLDEGALTDAKGRVVNFKNTVIILTSNLGSKAIQKGGQGLGFEFSGDDQDEVRYQQIRSRVMEEMKQFFRPEFLNRLDDVIVFRQLLEPEVAQIADLMLQEVADRLAQQSIALDVTPAFKAKVVKQGYDPTYGARPLRRAVMSLLEDGLAEAILSGQVKAGETALVDVNGEDQVTVQRKDRVLALVG